MIITHLAVSGVGRFRSRHLVKGFGPGLNLLCAPNEQGKSTLFRALHACLFMRHGSETGEINALATLGAQLPVTIEVGFEQDRAQYTIQKSFLQRERSRLLKDGQPYAEGRRADEKVWEILGVHENKRSVDRATFGLLWVEQGSSFDPVKPTESARATLNRLVEAEVGQVLGGERGERVRQSVGAQLAKEETDRRNPRAGGEWKRATDAVEKARSDLSAVRTALRELEADLKTLEGLLARQRALEAPGIATEIHADLERAQQDLAHVQRAQAAWESAEAEARRCALAHELAERRARDLHELDQRIAGGRARLDALSREAANIEAAYQQQACAHAEAEQRVAVTAAALAEAETEWDRVNRLSIAVANSGAANDIRSRLNRARELHARLVEIDALLATEGLSQAQYRNIEAATSRLETLQQQREANAPQVTITLGPNAGDQVRLQGEVIRDACTVGAVEPLAIDIAGIASIQVIPAVAPDDVTAIETARETLASELRKGQAASLSDAQTRRARTEQCEDERRASKAELDAIAPSKAGEDGIGVLERRLAAAEAALSDLTGDEPCTSRIDADALAVRREEAAARRDATRRRHQEAQTLLGAARSELKATEFQQIANRNALATLRESLESDNTTAPDSERTAQLAALTAAAVEAREALAQARERAQALRADLPSEEHRAALAARVKRLADALASRQRELHQLEIDIAALRARIAMRGGEGLGERAAELEDELAVAERDQRRIEAHVSALRLLRDTIDDCRTAARDAYLAPIKRGMQPFLHALFPGAEAQFDDGFVVESLRRDGPEPEPFSYLSHGTREQIAVMVRLALGGLLAARGQPTPVLLDDALVFSDDDRIERMFDVLTKAAEKHQIIVLTCRNQAFEKFGGRRLTIVREDAS